MFSQSNYRLCFRLLGLVTLLAIAVGSLMPLPAVPQQMGSDKLHHFLAYAFLTFCFMQSVYSTKYRLLFAIGFVLLGILIEFIQPSVNRYFEYADMLANTIGIIVGFISGGLFYSMIRRWLQKPAHITITHKGRKSDASPR